MEPIVAYISLLVNAAYIYSVHRSVMNINNIDPVKTFISLKQKHPNAFLFESNELTIIGLDHEEVLRLVGDQVISSRDGVTQELTDNFLDYLSMKLESLGEVKGTFPYEHGGAFGCLGYEIVSMLEPKLKKVGYFEKLSGSSEVLAEIFFSKNLIIFEHDKNKIHVASKLKVMLEEFEVRDHLACEIPVVISEDFEGTKSLMGGVKFQNNVKKIKSHIKAGDIFQAVLSERFEFKTNASPLNVYAMVKTRCPSDYSFYFDFKEGAFFGASPETLVKVKAGILETHPIAGTRPRGCDEKDDLLLERQLKRSTKEGAEHLMLVDLARNDLGRVSKAGTIKVEIFRKILRLSNVMHLVSVVKGEKKSDKTDLEALSACFPAGTLSGAPKVRAMEILSGLESQPRGFYGGAVVAFDHGGGFDSCIAIRAVEIKDQTVILRAGAGIVADSQSEKEYQEIKHKLKALLSAVKAAEESPMVEVFV
jgi:anthranilate synthase component 1